MTRSSRILGGSLSPENEKRRLSKRTKCNQCGYILGEKRLDGIANDGKQHSFCSFECTDKFNDSIASA